MTRPPTYKSVIPRTSINIPPPPRSDDQTITGIRIRVVDKEDNMVDRYTRWKRRIWRGIKYSASWLAAGVLFSVGSIAVNSVTSERAAQIISVVTLSVFGVVLLGISLRSINNSMNRYIEYKGYRPTGPITVAPRFVPEQKSSVQPPK